jgi:hypothetical protein
MPGPIIPAFLPENQLLLSAFAAAIFQIAAMEAMKGQRRK